ncbi:o-succinylbenzoate synthase [Metabacillus sp. GX 13764]|uniref:o-succinylbenzoate synthase n=1 Tax=Metabacillus kandeliae TaxID=2900151 RepID=UPI001E436FC6|nr:o-succinylbenzoate synthase [Metabacillus kandeliae]MCD7032614.1 o-succinylbenzoate synthase [Metabacillus kandeliae]
MKIKHAELYFTEMKLIEPFVSSLEKVEMRESIIVKAVTEEGVTGWGEAVAFSSPWYTEETVQTVFHMLKDFLIPLIAGKEFSHPKELGPLFSKLKRNYMAKAAIEGAVWDCYAKEHEKPLSAMLGGTRSAIEAGVVIGLAPRQEMIKKIDAHLSEGYKRFKVKIKPGQDVGLIREIRKEFPALPMMADANSAYTLEDIDHLKALDEFSLMMIEQPLAADDIVDHAILQRELQTPICLDESIVSLDDARKAIELGSCRVINIKPGRVGGLQETVNIHNYCMEKNIPVWCGGMLETGVSRAHNIACASLPNFSIPGDISASSRYWEEDIISPEVTVKNGKIQVPEQAGIGFQVDMKKLDKYTKHVFAYQM